MYPYWLVYKNSPEGRVWLCKFLGIFDYWSKERRKAWPFLDFGAALVARSDYNAAYQEAWHIRDDKD